MIHNVTTHVRCRIEQSEETDIVGGRESRMDLQGVADPVVGLLGGRKLCEQCGHIYQSQQSPTTQ